MNIKTHISFFCKTVRHVCLFHTKLYTILFTSVETKSDKLIGINTDNTLLKTSSHIFIASKITIFFTP
jgi:hypothetical protein